MNEYIDLLLNRPHLCIRNENRFGDAIVILGVIYKPGTWNAYFYNERDKAMRDEFENYLFNCGRNYTRIDNIISVGRILIEYVIPVVHNRERPH